MVYVEPHWDKLFLQMTAINSVCHEYRVWGDTENELVDYAHQQTPLIAATHEAKVIEYLIWCGVPSPMKSTVRKWTYKPTIRNNQS